MKIVSSTPLGLSMFGTEFARMPEGPVSVLSFVLYYSSLFSVFPSCSSKFVSHPMMVYVHFEYLHV